MRPGIGLFRKPYLLFRPNLEALEDRITPVLLSNGLPPGTVGAFAVDVGDGGDITSTGASSFTFAGQVTDPYTSNTIYQYSTYVAPGGKGGAFDLSATTITQPATLVNGQVVSKGYFTGETGQQINWVATDSLTQSNGNTQLVDQIIFGTVGSLGLGPLSVIQYLDEDTTSAVNTDLLIPRNVGTNNLLLFTMSDTEQVGLGQGGYLQRGLALQNADFLGWAADSYPNLQNDITGPGVKYKINGTINSKNLPGTFNSQLQQLVYGPNDVSTALAWSVDPAARSAIITPYLQDIPTPLALPYISTTLPNLSVGQPFSTTLSSAGPAATLGYGLASGSLPYGMTLNSRTGVLQGTPTVAGTYHFTLSVSDNDGLEGFRAYTVTVNQVATSLQFVQQPANTQAGATIGPAVTVQMLRNGSPLAVAGDTIALSLASGTGVLLGTTSAVTDASGLATFSNLQIDSSGLKTLQAGTGKNVSTSSAPFSIAAAAASQLVFVNQPTLSKPGQTMTTVTVQLEDPFGNPTSQGNVPITLAPTAGSSPLQGTLTQCTNALGLATFNDLQMNSSGRQRLQASSAGLASALSGSFNVAGPAVGFLFTLSASIMDNQSYTFTVQAVDSLGDPALAPSNLIYPTLTIESKGTYLISPVGRSADGISWIYTLVSRTLGPTKIQFQAIFDYPAALGGNRTMTTLLNFTTTF